MSVSHVTVFQRDFQATVFNDLTLLTQTVPTNIIYPDQSAPEGAV